MSFRIFLMAACLLYPDMVAAQVQPAATTTREYRVLLVGNSLTYTNNLSALLRAVGVSQGISIATESYMAPGGTLTERWVEGHVIEALQNRKFDILILQEQGGDLAICSADAEQQAEPSCRKSVRAQIEFAKLARKYGARTLLFATWGPDSNWEPKLDRSFHVLAAKSSAGIFDANGVLRALSKAEPGIELFPDGVHPSIRASLMLALALYRDITGTQPIAKDLRVTASLLPVNAAISAVSPMESQSRLAGDGKIIVVPASLLDPLVKALPEPKLSGEMDPADHRR